MCDTETTDHAPTALEAQDAEKAARNRWVEGDFDTPTYTSEELRLIPALINFCANHAPASLKKILEVGMSDYLFCRYFDRIEAAGLPQQFAQFRRLNLDTLFAKLRQYHYYQFRCDEIIREGGVLSPATAYMEDGNTPNPEKTRLYIFFDSH